MMGHDVCDRRVTGRHRTWESRHVTERTILVVDDDAPNRAVLGIVCAARGHTVIEAGSGADALAAAAARRPDLILLDIGLPDVSGLEVCRRLRGAGVEAPILMLSGHADPADLALARRLGADGYLAKPYAVRELVDRVEEHLAGPRRHAA